MSPLGNQVCGELIIDIPNETRQRRQREGVAELATRIEVGMGLYSHADHSIQLLRIMKIGPGEYVEIYIQSTEDS